MVGRDLTLCEDRSPLLLASLLELATQLTCSDGLEDTLGVCALAYRSGVRAAFVHTNIMAAQSDDPTRLSLGPSNRRHVRQTREPNESASRPGHCRTAFQDYFDIQAMIGQSLLPAAT